MPPHDPMLDIRASLLEEARRRLRGGSSAMCMTVVGALRALPGAAGLDGLVQALGDAEVQVRVEAVRALSELPNGAGLVGLAQALGDADEQVRSVASEALRSGTDADGVIGRVLRAPALRVSDRLVILETLAPRLSLTSETLPARLGEMERRHADPAVQASAREVVAWIEQRRKLPVAGQAGEPDRSRDGSAADGSVADRSRDASPAPFGADVRPIKTSGGATRRLLRLFGIRSGDADE